MFRSTVLFFVLLALGLPGICSAQNRNTARGREQVRIGEAVISAGLQVEETALDCSHFVNALFQQVGIYYRYQPSRVLYGGVPGFKRVYRPSEGDLIVWPGHVGVIVDPAEQTFLSALSRGVKVSSYVSRYWQRRGHARFFRYSLPVSSPTWLARNSHLSTSSTSDGLD